MTAATKTEFAYETSGKGLGYNKPQTMGRKLWAPMFVMGLMGFVVGVILSWVRPDVRSFVDLLTARLLGRHIRGRA